jgi:hypothetical protein
LLPGETRGVAGFALLSVLGEVDHVGVQILSRTYTASDPIPPLTSENVVHTATDWSYQVTGQIVSPYAKDVKNLLLAAIAYDAEGNIIGSGPATLKFVPANGKAAAKVDFYSAEEPARVELYARIRELKDVK